jgi:hypothetical protein
MSNKPNFVDRAIRDFERQQGRKPTKEELSRWADQPDVRAARAKEQALLENNQRRAILAGISPVTAVLLAADDLIKRTFSPRAPARKPYEVTAPIADNTRAGRAAREEVAKGSTGTAAAPPPPPPPPPPPSRAASTKEERPARSTGTANTAAATTEFTLSAETLSGLDAASAEERSVNTNTELTNEDGTIKARTSNSAFSTGERTTGTFNIGRFRAEVSGADSVLPTHSFLVVFAPMIWTRSKFSAQNLDSLLTMRCDNVVLPSVNLLQEQNIRRYGFGPVENVAYGVNVGDFTLQFIVDKNALVIEYFEEWLNLIVNRDSFGGANMNNNNLKNGRKPYEIAYKDTYSCPNVNVFVYDRAQNQVMTYNIYDVFPTGIQSMNMSWSEENNLMKLNITFSFTDLRINRIPPKTRVDDKSFKDEIKVTATGKYADIARQGSSLATLDPSGDIARRLTDLSNETTIIGDFAGRIRGSVTPVQLSTPTTNQTADVSVQKNVSTLNVRINPPA